MKPCWAEADQTLAVGAKEPVHDPQNLCGVLEVLERVDGKNLVGGFVRCGVELADLAAAGILRLLPGYFQNVVADVDTDHAPGTGQRHLDRFGSFAASEVHHGVSGDSTE